jgi:hypothetical protein
VVVRLEKSCGGDVRVVAAALNNIGGGDAFVLIVGVSRDVGWLRDVVLWRNEYYVAERCGGGGTPWRGQLLADHILVYRIPFTRMWTNWTTTSQAPCL